MFCKESSWSPEASLCLSYYHGRLVDTVNIKKYLLTRNPPFLMRQICVICSGRRSKQRTQLGQSIIRVRVRGGDLKLKKMKRFLKFQSHQFTDVGALSFIYIVLRESCTVYSVHTEICKVQCAQRDLYSTVCTERAVQCTVCTQRAVQYSVHRESCTVYILHKETCTVYSQCAQFAHI